MNGNASTTAPINSLNSTQAQILIETIRTALDGIREGVKNTHRHKSFDEDFQQLTMLCLAELEQRPIEDIIAILHADTLAEAKNPYRLEKIPSVKHQALLELEQHIKRKDPKLAIETLNVLQQEPSTNPVYLAEIQSFKEKLEQLRIGKDKNKPLPEGLRAYMLHLRKAYLGFPEQHMHSYGPEYPTFYLNVDIIDLSRFNDSAHPVSRATIQQWIPIITALYPIYEQELEEKDEQIKKLQAELKQHLQIEADKQKAIDLMIQDYNNRLLKTPDTKPITDELAQLRQEIETKKFEAGVHKAEKERLQAELKAMQEVQTDNNRKQQEIEQLRQQLAEATKPSPNDIPSQPEVTLLPKQDSVNETSAEKTKTAGLFSGIYNFFSSSDQGVLSRARAKYEFDYRYYSSQLILFPNDIIALVECGNCSYLLIRYEEAFDYFKRALQIKPKDPDILASAGYSLLKQKKYQAAIEYFKRAYEHRYSEENFDLRARNTAGLAKAYICLAKYEKAKDYLREAFATRRGNLSTRAFYGDLALSLGYYQDAIESYELFLKDHREAINHSFYPEVCYHKGIAHRNLNELSNASEWVGKALKVNCFLTEAKEYYEDIQANLSYECKAPNDTQATNSVVR